MRRALAQATAAAEAGEVPVGAVVVRDGLIVAASRNAMRTRRDPTAHAEMEVLRAAAAALETERLDGCDLWVTLEPCAMCAGAIALSRIRRLYFAAADPKGGAVLHGPMLFSQPTCHHAPEVYPGIGEEEAAAMLRGFFTVRRR
jgi:tRNA(Arg) A34 adenosine deaminase TadA